VKRIRIFDTTLRDGEQAPGFAMRKEEKVIFAKQLEALGVDVIEAGFPIASTQDFEAVQAIAKVCIKVEVCALARCNEKDIECAIKALEHASKPRIHVFIATSEIHLKYKLKMSCEEVIARAVKGVTQARAFTMRVEFSPEDASRSDRNFLVEVLEAVIAAGADVLNIPDTVGYMTPEEYGDLIKYLTENVKGIENVIISTHCHDDLGLAVANSLSGVLNGAGQVECTINGVGERAGNAALEEVVMTMKTRQDIYSTQTNIDTVKLVSTSQALGEITGHKVPPNKAIVGKNAFAHGSGIHQHGMLSNHQTYEVMDPKDVGFESTQIVLSKHSGKHALKHRIQALGIDLDNINMDEVFVTFKALADRKKCVYDEDLMMIVKTKNNRC
jgi:2-isopropylmalate synthase